MEAACTVLTTEGSSRNSAHDWASSYKSSLVCLLFEWCEEPQFPESVEKQIHDVKRGEQREWASNRGTEGSQEELCEDPPAGNCGKLVDRDRGWAGTGATWVGAKTLWVVAASQQYLRLFKYWAQYNSIYFTCCDKTEGIFLNMHETFELNTCF